MNKDFKHTKQTGFKTPNDYFNNLEDAVFDKLNAKSNLDSIDNPGFGVPNDYFSTIESKVMDAIKNDEKEVKVVSLLSRRNLLYMSGVAAAVVLMFSIFITKDTVTFDSIDTELVESYISTQNINSSDLAALWNETEFSDFAFDEYELLDETVEDYILENSNIEDLLID